MTKIIKSRVSCKEALVQDGGIGYTGRGPES